jgi:hypothetical protein
MITPYDRRRLSRSLATAAGALVLVSALAGCVPNPPTGPVEATTSPSATEAGSASPTAAPPSTSDVTPLGPLSGTWEGTWVNTTPTAAIGTFTLVWAQQDDQLFGALTVVGSNCLRAGNVTGDIVGKGLSFGAIEGDTTIQYTGTIVDDDTIEGTYESDCGDSAGTWTATRANT